MLKACEGVSKSVSRSLLCTPRSPVNAMRGKSSALAWPMSALAAMRVCSAARTSGRRSMRSDGRPEGSEVRTGISGRARPRRISPG